jgi:Dyp-type peroxidase family
MNESVELHDVQGIIIKGYDKLKAATFLLLEITDTQKTKQWIAAQLPSITHAKTSTQTLDSAIQIAFTYAGVTKLNVPAEGLLTFPPEFIEGMVTEHRSRMLGDLDDSAPDKWTWGGTEKDFSSIHLLLMIYATDDNLLQHLLAEQKAALETADLKIVYQLDTSKLPNEKEHFGFRDGIAQPIMRGINHTSDNDANMINPGEFIFGYQNEYEKYMFSPTIKPEHDPSNILPADMNNAALKDLGRNGSMLVFRQLEQNVKAFWDMADKAAKEQSVAQDSIVTAEHIASKMLGRWPNGSPLTKCPMHPDDSKETFDNFGYAKNDYDGLKCPIGSHIRRANPRDNFLRDSTGDKEKDIEKSMMFMKRFRILRRGRSYGAPLVESMDPKDIIQAAEDNKERGLYFLCFNSNIGRQFELIQQTWINNPKFAGLYEDPDPMIGYPGIMGDGATTTFTEQAFPVRKQVKGITRFVNVKGGAYFFMPGLNALKYISSI